MRFLFSGVNRVGIHREFIIEAPNKDTAVSRVESLGYDIHKMTKISDEDSVRPEQDNKIIFCIVGLLISVIGTVLLNVIPGILAGIMIVGGLSLLFGFMDWKKVAKDLGQQQKDIVKQKASQRIQQTKIICPHCNESGCVTTRNVKRKKGISGAKATGAIVTGGWSLLATGLSRKENETEAKCSNCGSVWHH